MSNINKRLSELSPHVLSIRFTKGISVVDSFFKEGWTLPKTDSGVGFEPIPDKPNYYMLYPLNENVGIDEMLDYVNYTIKVNVEREMKIKLLQIKINELKQLFTKSSLATCKTLKFSFSSAQISTDNEDIDLNDMPIIENSTPTNVVNEDFSEKALDNVPLVEQPPIDDDIRKFNSQTAKVNNETFDLPPKKGNKIVLEEFDEPEVVCKCNPNDPNEVCPVCVGY